MHVVPRRSYFTVFVALMMLTMLTYSAAYWDFGSLNFAIAMAIAVTKATLVVLIFMHVRYSARLVWVFVVAGFAWLFLMIAGTFQDYLSRGWMGG